jgi:PKD repeat protein
VADGSAENYSSISWSSSGDGTFVGGDTETPDYNPGPNDILAGTVTLTMDVEPISPCTTTATDDMVIDIDPLPTADAGVDDESCTTDPYTLNGAATNHSSFSWGSSGTGTWTNQATLTPTYTPSASDVANGSVVITLTVNGSGACPGSVTSQMTLIILEEPTANAGTDQTICEAPFNLNATAENYSSVQWTTSGSGSFSDANILNPVYTPSGDAGSSVTLTLTAQPEAACSAEPAAIDDVVLKVVAEPTAFAGNDATICENSDYTLTDATATNHTTLTWTTSGTGNFSNEDVLNPVYTPSAADIANGGVTLTLTSWNASCGNVSNSMVLTINEKPEADAGDNGYLCDGDATFTTSTASADHYSSVQWTSDGDGSFTNANSVTATYNTHPNDFTKNFITLTLTANAEAPCTGSAISTTRVYFQDKPTADVGIVSAPTICEDDTYSVTTASASNYSSVTWTSSGDGTWTNQNTLFPTYTPGTNDRTVGSVDLTLTASPVSPCGEPATSQFTLNIEALPEADAGDDEIICAGTDIVLSTATASDYNSISWSTTGSGGFDDNGNLNAVYTPSNADIAAGTITLSLEATSNAPCSGSTTDNMTLTIVPEPTISAGTDASICGNGTDTYFIFDATATNYNSVSWTTSGDGTFDDASNVRPVYTPGSDDITTGTVTLEMTAFPSSQCTDFVTDQMTITLDPLPSVDVGDDATICDTETFTRTATVNDYSALLWETTGSGTFNNRTVPGITYSPSPADISNGQVTLTLTASGNDACSADDVTDELVLSFEQSPSADAGPDQEICEDGITISTASASDYNIITWTSSGSAGTISNSNTISPTYIPSPSDIASGSVTLTLTASANNPCGVDATDDVVITINAYPTVDAGPDQNICEDESYTVIASDVSVSDYSDIYWTTAGDGSFINNGTLTPTYAPGTNDISNGSVEITLNAEPNLPCTTEESDSFILNIEALPVVDAGSNVIVCEGSTHTTSDATVTNYTSVTWTTSGDGTFNNANLVNTTYTPGTNDIANGDVTLTLSAASGTVCGTSIDDSMVITFQNDPIADAGSDIDICEGSAYTISAATAENYSTVSWSTAGDGSFTNAGTLTPTYTPGSADISNGSVVLTLTANAESPCTGTATSDVTMTIHPTAVVDAGADAEVCEGESYTVNDSDIQNYSSIVWSASGSGTLTNASTENPTYAPDANDVAVGTVVLTATVQPNTPCSNPVTDQLTLTIVGMPQADAGSDQLICDTDDLNITEATASGYASLSWTSSGTGIFSDNSALNPIYYPSSADIAGGGVTITLTANSETACSSDVSDSFVLTITEQVTVDAGADENICQAGSVTLNGSVDGDYSLINWTHDGDGSISGAGTLTPTYTASASESGTVTLTMTATGSNPCDDASDEVVLTVQPFPVVDAGPDVESCEDQEYQITGITASDYSTLTWTTSGTGAFTNENILEPQYMPSAADITSGSVVLTLTADPVSPCAAADGDSFVLNFLDAASANAGPDFSVCENEIVEVTGASAADYSSLLWTASGTGTFVAGTETSLTPQYQPSNDDIISGSVTLTLTASGNAPCDDAFDEVVVTLSPDVTAYAGDDATMCEDGSFTVSTASASDYADITWVASGSGTLMDDNTLTPTYTPSASDIANGQVELTLTATAIAPCTGDATSSMTLFFEEEPTAFAGNDATLCDSESISLDDATATNYGSLSWTTTGSGTFTNSTDLNPTYTPSAADYAAGSVTLQLTASANTPCTGNATDELILNLIPAPTVEAGNNGTICEDESFTVSTASASGYGSLNWTSSGTGTVADASTLTPTYTPSAADISNGTVTLTLSATGEAPCSEVSADQMVITINSLPTADAGSDAVVCFGDTYTVSDADATNYSALSWTSSGSGTFTNATTLTPTYTPSAADYNNGTVELMLHVDAQSGCSGKVTDIMVLTLHDETIADAGDDAEICENNTYTLSTASAENYSTIVWSSSGDGSFDNTGAENPVYTPGTNDIASGTATLTLTATAEAPCTDVVSDNMVLTISPLPVADAGPDVTICETSYTHTGASASDYSSLTWTSSGTGTLSNANSLTPTYTASAGDVANGTVTLTLTAAPLSPCATPATSTVVLTINESAEVYAGNDANICETNSYHITDATTNNSSAISWSTSGDGYFVNGSTISPTYHPGTDDQLNGDVTLTVTASSNAPCTQEVSDDMVINLFNGPVADAGDDISVCEGNVTVSDATASDYLAISWSSNGTGSFSNGSTLTPTYSPSAADIANGSVTLSLTAQPVAPCSNTVTDQKLVTFTEAPEANAGANADICSTETLSITDASASDYASLEWTTNGDGSFSDNSAISTIYTPGNADISNGTVQLTLTALANAPCADDATDIKTVTIEQQGPVVNAGTDQEICETESLTVTDASGSNYSGVTWSTSGSGSFSNQNTLTPTYTASASDINLGSVILTVTASPNGSCGNPVSDDLLLTIQKAPAAYAGEDDSSCGTTGYAISAATASDYASLTWTTSGSGTFVNNGTISPTYIPSTGDISNGSVLITLIADAASPCAVDATDSFALSLFETPSATAGDDVSICETATYTVDDAAAEDYSSITWNHNGSGTLSNENTLTPTYTPSSGDVLSGQVTLTLVASANAPCTENVSDNKIITIQASPTADAGTDDEICETESFTTSGTASSYGSLIWTTSGSGTFTNAGTLTATYTPSSADINAGSVVLTLTAAAESPCSGNISDQITLSIVEEPAVSAGSDANIVSGDTYTPSDASADNYDVIFWETNGDGTFENAGTLTPTYTPGSDDLASGSVTLTLNGTSNAPCSGSVSDGMLLTFTADPIANAGSDASVCEDNYFVPTDASASNYSSIAWTTSGTGTLVNSTTLTPTYIPSATDISNGSVLLTLTAQGVPPNTATDSDFMVLTFVENPTADAGLDATTCSSSSFTVSTATASNYSVVTWTSSGSGSFSGANTLTPTYTPSDADISNGQVILTLTADPMNGCTETATDQMTLTLEAAPQVNAGTDIEICEDGVVVTSAASASDYNSLTWNTSGTGSFTDPSLLVTQYTPSPADITNGQVVLTLTADGNAPCADQVSDNMTVTFTPNPTVYAGSDANVCEGDTYTVDDATANNYTSINWVSDGTGLLTGENTLTPTYDPSAEDILNGSVTLTMEVTGNAVCPGTFSDEMTMIFQPSPTADAGATGEICEGQTFTVSGASVSNASSYLWTHNGGGSLVNASSLTPTYISAADDSQNSPVQLILTAQGLGGCGQSAQDVTLLTVNSGPQVYAGADNAICNSGNNYTIADATASDYSSVMWTHTGAGTLLDPTTVNPVYVPHQDDFNSGSVLFTMSAQPVNPCTDAVSDAMVLTMNDTPLANAGADAEICETDTYDLDDATASDYSSITWTTSGDGIFSDASVQNPVYTPGTGDIANGNVTLTMGLDPVAPCSEGDDDQMVITFVEIPTADAGSDAQICETGSYQVFDAAATNYSTINWTTSGDGSFTGAATLTPEYFPGTADATAGSVTLTIEVTGIGDCNQTVTDAMVITLDPAPQVDAGSDGTVCGNTNYQFTTATATDYSSLSWTTSGTGSFDDNTAMNPEYIPSTQDVNNGSVVLTLSAEGFAPCNETESDQMTLIFQQEAVADAGSDQEVCESEVLTLADANANNYSSVSWTTSGDGTFSNANILNPDYTPGVNDIASGSVILTMEVQSANPCTGSSTDDVLVTITQEPIADAGPDDAACSSAGYTLSAATASNYSSLQWTSDGSGTFDNSNTLNAHYTPSNADITSGSVTLTLEVTGIDPCNTTITDDMVLTINQSAIVDAGNNASTCQTDAYTLSSASASFYTNISWISSGTGSFDDSTIENPTYTPSAADVSNGQVQLTITAQGNSPCNETVQDVMILSITEEATVFAGSDFNDCNGGFTLNEATAENYSNISWTSSGTGIFDNNTVVNAVYHPSQDDKDNGSVTLTLTANSESPCTTVATDDIVITLLPDPVADAGSDAVSCEGDSYTVNDATAQNYSSVSWSSSGSGGYTNANTLMPTYLPSQADYTAGSVVLTLTAQGIAPCGETTDTMTLSFVPAATASAGPDQTICEGPVEITQSTATNYSAISWTTSGTGSFVNPDALNPVYIPSDADADAGFVVLTIIADGQNPCTTSATDDMVLNITPEAEANAGADDMVCEGQDYLLTGATANYYSDLSWTTSGTGTFSNDAILNPIYFPSTQDLNAGSVTLTLIATSGGSCPGEVSDALTLTLQQQPEASAGEDAIVCETNSYVLSEASANDYSNVQWFTTGSGSFDDPNIVNATYTPSASDILDGSVTLTLTASPVAPCFSNVSDEMTLNIHQQATANAGGNLTSCGTESIDITGASASNYANISWTTSGTGAFEDNSLLNPVYTPGEQDVVNATVTLTITASSNNPCVGTVSDNMIVSISELPSVDAGLDDSFCEDGSYQVSDASASDYSSIVWDSDGTGSLVDANTFTPTYTPSAQDIVNGSVTLTLSANGASPCDTTVSDEKLLQLYQNPVAFAGNDTVVCGQTNYELEGATTENYSSFSWSSDGTGTFINPGSLQPTYIPSMADVSSGNVIITLTADAEGPCTLSASDSFILTFNEAPVVDAGVDQNICATENVSLNATADNEAGIEWTTSGDGVFTDASSVSTTYIPGSEDIENSFVALTITAQGSESCEGVSDNVVITFTEEPELIVDNSFTLCEGTTLLTFVEFNNYSSIQWTTTGTGTLNNPNSETPEYTVSNDDMLNGTVSFTITAQPAAPCSEEVSQSVMLEIQSPLVDAGTDDFVCETSSYLITDAGASNYDMLQWSTSGNGTFNDSSLLYPVYSPGDVDIEAGMVTLTLTGVKGNCNPVSDEMVLTLDPLPEVNAGPNSDLCEDGVYNANAIATNYSSLEWTSSGTGTFSDNTVLNPSYTPSAQDVQNGSVVLTLSATPDNSCTDIVSDAVIVNFYENPIADAGVDTLICQNQGYEILTSDAANYASLEWTTSGSGSFDNSSILHPVYFPSEADAQAGSVTLTLAANQTACGTATDNLVLQVTPEPQVYAGPDATVVFNSNLPLVDAEVSNASGFTWYSSGTGDFIPDENTLNASYDPSSFDESNGEVTLTLIAQGNTPCENVSDSLHITLVNDPNLDFTFTDPCIGVPVQFNIDESITDVDALVSYYWEFGDGESSNQYEPAHVYNTSGTYQVHLTVTDTVGHSTTVSQYLSVAELPQPFFNTDAPSCSGSAVQFTDYTNTPSGYATSWHWDFGDGSDTLIDFPDSPHVTHAYALAGTYEATLTVETNLGCVNDYTREVTVHPSPITLFTWEAACGGQPTPFTDLSVENGGGDIIAWYWHFDNPESGTANTSEAQHPEHTFTGAGSYDVQLVTENIHGCTDTLIQPVEVTEGPAVAFTYDSTCFEQLSTFTADASVMDTAAIGTWLWEFGDGYSSNDPVSVQHLYNVPGDYSVTLTVTDTLGCTSSLTQTVQVLPLPMAQFGYDQPACFGNSVLFDDYSTTEEGYITTWHYAFGDGSDTTINHPENPNISHDYATPGDYEATLTVTSSTGCQDEITHTVTVEPIPEVNFDYSLACQSTAVEFEDLTQEAGSGDILAWHWNFGDPLSGANNTSSQQHPDHVYSTPGDYAVTLTVETANGCSDSLSQTVTVSPAPEVGFVYTASCLNDTVDFVSSTEVDTDAIISYAWSFGDGGTASGADPQHIYTQEGTYEVSLTVTDTTGCSNTATETLTITPLPVAAFSFTTNTCANESVMFQDASYAEGEALVSWTWEFGDGSDTTIQSPDIPDVEHAYPDAGTYEASLTVVTENGCSHTTSHTVEVLQIPAAQYSFEGGCQNEAVSFTDASQPNGGGQIASWSWNFDDPTTGGDNTSSLPNPAHFFSEADTFDVQLVVGNLNGCTDTVMHAVGVADAPEVGILAPDALCQGQPAMFMPDTTIVDTLAAQVYEWTFGDGSDPVYQQEASHTYTLAGTYTVTLSVTDTTGCVNQAQTTVQVGQTPVPVFDYQAACLGGETQFTDLSYTPGGEPVTSWYWDFGDPYADSADNHSSLQHPVHVYPVDSTYEVKLVVQTTGGCTDSIVSEVEVRPVPDAWFSYDTTACQGGQVQFYDSSFSDNSAVTAWQWTFEEGYTSDLQNPSYTFGEVGETYPVELVAYDAFGCSDTTIREVTIPEGFAVDFEFTSTCLGDTTFFTDSLVSPEGDSVIAVQWTFGDPGSGGANVSDQHNPEHYYSQPGTYNVTLEATNENYCTTTVSHALQVHALPEPDFTWQSYPCDSAVYVSDATTTAGVITQWIWHWGDGSSDVIAQGEDPDISHVYEQAGSYEVTLEVQNSNGCVNTFSQQVYREPCVAAEIVLQSDTLCHGDELVFADSSQIQEVIESWTWNFGDGSSEITYNTYQPEISHTFPNTGSYQVTLTVAAMFDGQMREHTDTLAVVIHPVPEAEFTWTEGCLNQPVAFGDSTSAEDAVITSWRWDFGEESLEADTSRQQHPEWGYSTFGEHEVVLQVMNEFGCRDTVQEPITVYRVPEAVIGHDSSCYMQPTQFYDLSDTNEFTGEIISWQWDFGVEGTAADTAVIAEPEYMYVNQDSRTVTLQVEDEFGCGDTTQKVVTTHPVPEAVFEVEENFEDMQGRFAMNNVSEGAVDYQWDFDRYSNGAHPLDYHYDAEYHEQERPVIVFEEDGYFELELVAFNEFNCPDTMRVVDSMLFKGLFVPNAFSPNNPHGEVQRFKPAGINLETYHMQVYDVKGNLLWETRELDDEGSPAQGWDGTYDGAPLPQGVYVWKAEAMFEDGTVWQGDEVGSSELSSGKRYGTVTLIR